MTCTSRTQQPKFMRLSERCRGDAGEMPGDAGRCDSLRDAESVSTCPGTPTHAQLALRGAPGGLPPLSADDDRTLSRAPSVDWWATALRDQPKEAQHCAIFCSAQL